MATLKDLQDDYDNKLPEEYWDPNGFCGQCGEEIPCDCDYDENTTDLEDLLF